MTDLRRRCCCGDGPFGCVGEIDYAFCTPEICFEGNPTSPSAGGRADLFCIDRETVPIDASSVRVEGLRETRVLWTFDDFTIQDVETRIRIDYVAGLLWQYDRPVSEADVVSAFGSGHLVQISTSSATTLDPRLFYAFASVTNSRDEINGFDRLDKGYIFGVQNFSTIGFGNRFGLRVVTSPRQCFTPVSFRETDPVSGSFTDYAFRSSFEGRPTDAVYDRYDEVHTIRQDGTSAGRRLSTERLVETISRVYAFDDLGPHWEGPAGYDICRSIGSVAVDPNAEAISAAIAADPLRGCAGCGDG